MSCERCAPTAPPAVVVSQPASAARQSVSAATATNLHLRSARMALGAAQAPVAIAEHELLELPVRLAAGVVARVAEQACQRGAEAGAECFHGCVSQWKKKPGASPGRCIPG